MQDIKVVVVVVVGTMRQGARMEVAYEHGINTMFLANDVWLAVCDRPSHNTD